MEKHDVIVVGAGPAGLAVAARLQNLGVRDVVVLERESESGGVPRHCGHWGFGWESHRRLMSGPAYAARLRNDAHDLTVRPRHSVTEFVTANVMRVHSPSRGITEIHAKHVVLATGARESTRAARLIGGQRPDGILNTGTLQQMVYLKNWKPFNRPVIAGGEWVSFSALMTCKHANIKPAAMIIDRSTDDAPSIFRLGARLWYGVPVFNAAKVTAVFGNQTVDAVEIEQNGRRRTISCDGVIVSGRFRGEDALFSAGPLAGLKESLPGQPAETSRHLPHVWLVGNVAGQLKTAGQCVVEARGVADGIVARLK